FGCGCAISWNWSEREGWSPILSCCSRGERNERRRWRTCSWRGRVAPRDWRGPNWRLWSTLTHRTTTPSPGSQCCWQLLHCGPAPSERP
ncbi:hypothetical protein ANANG_G00107800, partial [Anguilla anguilla]